jgi:hypothetical protein
MQTYILPSQHLKQDTHRRLGEIRWCSKRLVKTLVGVHDSFLVECPRSLARVRAVNKWACTYKHTTHIQFQVCENEYKFKQLNETKRDPKCGMTQPDLQGKAEGYTNRLHTYKQATYIQTCIQGTSYNFRALVTSNHFWQSTGSPHWAAKHSNKDPLSMDMVRCRCQESAHTDRTGWLGKLRLFQAHTRTKIKLNKNITNRYVSNIQHTYIHAHELAAYIHTCRITQPDLEGKAEVPRPFRMINRYM